MRPGGELRPLVTPDPLLPPAVMRTASVPVAGQAIDPGTCTMPFTTLKGLHELSPILGVSNVQVPAHL